MARGDAVIGDYLVDKFTGSDDDDGRFKDTRGEYHASRTGKCPRKWQWIFEKERPDEASPYFELGPIFEDIYGEALKCRYGDDRVLQDVGCELRFEDFMIVGESDWVVLAEDAEYTPELVIRDEEGGRHVMTKEAPKLVDLDGMIDHVIETKTIKTISYVDRYGVGRDYLYQLSTYMWAFDCPGQVSYMERNDLSERVVPFEREKMRETDIFLRAQEQHEALDSSMIRAADPPSDKTCEWCHFTDECQEIGGKRWD